MDTEKLTIWLKSLPSSELSQIKELLLSLSELKKSNPIQFTYIVEEIERWRED